MGSISSFAQLQPSRGRPRERGRLLVEAVVATGIGAVALLALASLLPLALHLRRFSEERILAARAAEQRLAEIVAMDAPTFRRALEGPNPAALAFDVPGLRPDGAGAQVGAVLVAPAPGTPAFEQATLFQLTASCRWAGVNGPTARRYVTLYHPEAPRGGGP